MSLAVEPGEVLLTFAEISVAFTGFASIVAIFQKGSARGSESFDLFRFWIMLEFSLASLFFSLLPMVLHSLRLSDAAVWSVAGAVLILFMLAHAVFTSRLIRRGEAHVVASLTRGLSIGANAVYSAILASQLLNLTGVLGRSFGPYLLGLFLLLVGAAVNFVRLVWVGNASLLR